MRDKNKCAVRAPPAQSPDTCPASINSLFGNYAPSVKGAGRKERAVRLARVFGGAWNG
jgi:hypothetical protein